jgi:hypothetical protein
LIHNDVYLTCPGPASIIAPREHSAPRGLSPHEAKAIRITLIAIGCVVFTVGHSPAQTLPLLAVGTLDQSRDGAWADPATTPFPTPTSFSSSDTDADLGGSKFVPQHVAGFDD